MSDEKQVSKVEVTIKSDNHIHDGKPCKKGDKIKVRPDQAARLKDLGVV